MMIEEIKQLMNAESEAIHNIPVTDVFQQTIDLIFEHVHKKGGKLVCSGLGKAGQIAHNMATTFSSTGTPAVFLHPSEAQHGDLGILQGNDVMLLASNSGKTRELLEIVELTNGLYSQIPFIVMTGNDESPLGQIADLCMHTGHPKEICPLGLTPTTSTTVMTVIGDILVVQLMKKIGFTNQDYSKRHHGGYLGQKSRGAAGKGVKS